MTSGTPAQAAETKPQAWFLDTSALVTLAVHLPLQQAVVRALSPRYLVLVKAVVTELEELSKTSDTTATWAGTALGQLKWLGAAFDLDDPTGVRSMLNWQGSGDRRLLGPVYARDARREVRRLYNPAMAAGDVGPAYSLEYSLNPDDLRDFYATDDKLRTRRRWMAVALALCTAAAVTLMVFLVRSINAPVPRSQRHGQPLLWVATGCMTHLAIVAGRINWRLAPARLARLNWKKSPELHGRHRDDIGSQGVTITSPNGAQTSIPWSVIVSVCETSRGFVLRDRDGQARVALPKHGLDDPALLPALATYIREAAGMHPQSDNTAGSPTNPSAR